MEIDSRFGFNFKNYILSGDTDIYRSQFLRFHIKDLDRDSEYEGYKLGILFDMLNSEDRRDINLAAEIINQINRNKVQ